MKGTRRDIDLERKLEDLAQEVRAIRKHADLVLVANVKNPELLKVSSITVASTIQKKAGIESAPSIVARDSNRPQLLSEILTAYSLGLKSVMLVWGDRYPAGAGAGNAYDFRNLSEVIREAKRIGERAGIKPRILAPVTLASSEKTNLTRIGKERLRAGASLLLGQPPTTDPGETFYEHVAAAESAGLSDSVLLNVFPFRGRLDVLDCESYFGWKLPERFHKAAARGRKALLFEERAVVERLRAERLPGVYVATRGTPSVAADILG